MLIGRGKARKDPHKNKQLIEKSTSNWKRHCLVKKNNLAEKK